MVGFVGYFFFCLGPFGVVVRSFTNGQPVGRIDEFCYCWFLYTPIYSLDSPLYIYFEQ